MLTSSLSASHVLQQNPLLTQDLFPQEPFCWTQHPKHRDSASYHPFSCTFIASIPHSLHLRKIFFRYRLILPTQRVYVHPTNGFHLWLLRRSFCAGFSGLTHTLTHTAKGADGNSGNKRRKEHWFLSRKCWKRLKIVVFIAFLLFVISRSPVQVWPLAPETCESRKILAGFLFCFYIPCAMKFAIVSAVLSCICRVTWVQMQESAVFFKRQLAGFRTWRLLLYAAIR